MRQGVPQNRGEDWRTVRRQDIQNKTSKDKWDKRAKWIQWARGWVDEDRGKRWTASGAGKVWLGRVVRKAH